MQVECQTKTTERRRETTKASGLTSMAVFSKRECLKCKRVFRSEGNWNRICGRCREQATNEFDRRVRMCAMENIDLRPDRRQK